MIDRYVVPKADVHGFILGDRIEGNVDSAIVSLERLAKIFRRYRAAMNRNEAGSAILRDTVIICSRER